MKTVAVFAKKLNEVSLGCLKRMVELLQERGWGVACEVKLAGILEREHGYVPGFVKQFGAGELECGTVELLLSVGGGRYFPGFGGICEGKRHPGVGGERGTIGVSCQCAGGGSGRGGGVHRGGQV